MRKIELHYGAATDVGRVREVNEDAFLADPPVFVVADGMGGHEGGDVASAIVVEEFGALAGQEYDARGGAEQVATTLPRQPAPDRGVRRAGRPGAADAGGTPAPPPWSRCWCTTTKARGGWWPTSATPGPTAWAPTGSSG